jgi:hypothetical protein
MTGFKILPGSHDLSSRTFYLVFHAATPVPSSRMCTIHARPVSPGAQAHDKTNIQNETNLYDHKITKQQQEKLNSITNNNIKKQQCDSIQLQLPLSSW